MNEIMTRFTSESPLFFKRIQAIGITLGTIGGAILLIPSSVITFPAIVTTIAGYFVAIGSVAAAVAKTTVVDNSVLNKPADQPAK